MLAFVTAGLLAATPLPTQSEIRVTGPSGELAGTLVDAGRGAPVVLILPGSGPTDRDGNSPLGMILGSYRKLAYALAERQVSSVRIDKRGLFGSRRAASDPAAVRVADLVADARAWIDGIRARTGVSCVWLAGHSEGGVVALIAAQQPAGICGVAAIATPGRPLGQSLREQVARQPMLAIHRREAEAAVSAFEAGRTVPATELPGALRRVFAPAAQAYLIDMLRQRPDRLAATLRLPFLIVQGSHDTQVAIADARALAAARPEARLVIIPGINHMLVAAPEAYSDNLATYRDSSLPIDPQVVEALAAFVRPSTQP